MSLSFRSRKSSTSSFTPVRVTSLTLCSGTFAQASNTAIVLTGGLRPSQVYWQVAGTFTVGTTAGGAQFQGIALAATQVTLNIGSSVNGRILSQTAVDIRDTNVMQPSENEGCGGTVTVTAREYP